MKKLFNYLLIFLVLLMPVVSVNAATTTKKAKSTTTTTTEKTTKKSDKKDGVGTPVKLYVFYGSTCIHCAHLHEVISGLEADTSINYMFELVDYEVWSNTQNAELMKNVATTLGTTASGVPFYVVGEYYSSGFPDITSTDDSVKAAVNEAKNELVEAIKTAYNNANTEGSNYTDIVASVGSGEATVKDKKDTSANDVVGYIVLGVTVIIIVAIIFGRSSSKDEDETEEEVVEEEVKEETKKVEPKKTSAKKAPAKKTTTKKETTKKAAQKKTATKKVAKKAPAKKSSK